VQEATDHESNMSLIRASLKMRSANRHKTDAPMSTSSESHSKPPALCNTVQSIPRSNFDELCQIYPCQEPLSSDNLSQRSANEDCEMVEENCADSLTKIDGLCTADIVKIVLQPAVLDSIVTELEKNFLVE